MPVQPTKYGYLGASIGNARRNEPWRLHDPHPIPDYGRKDLESGNAGLDGYTVMARANPDRAGERPAVDAGEYIYWGPDMSWLD